MSKPTPKTDALRAMREANPALAGIAKTIDRMDLDDDATARVAALLVRAQDRLSTISDPMAPTPDEVLIHDLMRMLIAAFDEGDDYLHDDQIELPGFLTREPRP